MCGDYLAAFGDMICPFGWHFWRGRMDEEQLAQSLVLGLQHFSSNAQTCGGENPRRSIFLS
jgi:hypothetical protein